MIIHLSLAAAEFSPALEPVAKDSTFPLKETRPSVPSDPDATGADSILTTACDISAAPLAPVCVLIANTIPFIRNLGA